MNYHQYLYRTRALMDEVVKAMNNLAGSGSSALGTIDIRTITQRRGEFQLRLRECFYRIIDLWPEILANEARRFEVSRFISKYRAIRLAIRNAALQNALKPPFDTILPRYIQFLRELDEDMSLILKEFSDTVPPPQRMSLTGIAGSLRYYVQEADDEFYERLIIDRLTPAKPLNWHGTKVAATLFAKHFGLTDSEMNRTFIFPSHGKTYHGLKISSNIATKGDDKNGIVAILERYPYPG